MQNKLQVRVFVRGVSYRIVVKTKATETGIELFELEHSNSFYVYVFFLIISMLLFVAFLGMPHAT